MPKLKSACLITPDVPRLAEFYREVLQSPYSGDEEYAAFSIPGAGFSIFSLDGAEKMAPGFTESMLGSCFLEFEVQDVDREFARLVEMRVRIIKEPTTQPWGFRSVWFVDPEGNLINFYADLSKSAPAETGKDKVRRYFQRLLNEKDLSICDELLSPDYVDYDAPADEPRGPEGTKAFLRRFLQEYPDLHVTVEDVLEDGDKVAARLAWLGHHKESGEIFRQTGNIILRIDEHGQFAERWSAYHRLDS